MSDINKTPKRNVSVRDKIKIADSYISKIIAERESYIKTCMSEKKYIIQKFLNMNYLSKF